MGQSFGQSANFNSGYANHSGFLPRIYAPVSNLKTLDSDGDGMPDAWEKIYSFDLFSNDSAADLDGDGLSNSAEFLAGTLPNHADTDADGLSDGEEINQYDGDPLEKDTDGDGYEDFEEAQANSLLDDNLSFPGSNLTKYGYRGAVINTGGGWADNNFIRSGILYRQGYMQEAMLLGRQVFVTQWWNQVAILLREMPMGTGCRIFGNSSTG